MQKNKTIIMIVAALMFVLALGLTLYPPVSNYVNAKYASQIHTAYEEVIQKTDNSALVDERSRANAYNRSITPGAMPVEAFSKEAITRASENYEDILNISDDGIMGYLSIPKLEMELPIFHGTGPDALERGIGHLLGSSLPVGGESTHTILTGHSGMATQKMFTDLVNLAVGDVFYLDILGEKLAYQVEEQNTVLPHDTGLLSIIPGEDLCTLVTCTPYGVNTHRLLVRGSRIPYEEAQEIENETSTEEAPESAWEEEYIKGVAIGLLILLILLLIIFFVGNQRRGHYEAG